MPGRAARSRAARLPPALRAPRCRRCCGSSTASGCRTTSPPTSSLARGEGPAIGNAPGVAIAGTASWLPRRVRDRLLEEVEERGLAVASFGASRCGAPWRSTATVLRDPSPPRPDDLFGERTSVFRADPPAPLREESDELGLFAGVDAFFGEFSVFERSDRAAGRRPAARPRPVREEGAAGVRGLPPRRRAP